MSDNFMPEDYKVPTSSNYLKFQSGDNRFRIISRPIVGWEDWKDNKPLRFRMTEKPQAPIDAEKPIKHFWVMVVWDYKESRIAILEITQKGIQKTIEGLARNVDWGSPLNYDLVVTKTGSGFETEYATVPIPPKPLPGDIQALISTTTFNLDALFDGKDPFAAPF